MNIYGFIRGLASVTPSDTEEIGPGIGLYVGGGGNVRLTAEDGSTETMTNVPSGFYIPGRFTAVKSTDTTATDIVALY